MEFDHVFCKFKNVFLKISWLSCEQHGKNQYKEKEENQPSSVCKVLSNCHII